ncbi:MAG: YihY/virulence factor BrkB family protein, partial [Ruminiclostridium sp.]|nr:YihY/virulence factor BrkB family protein [Ruminiclostridium sp.]
HQTPGLFIAGLIACWFSASAAYRTIARVIGDVFRAPSQSILRDLIASIIFPVGLLLALDISVVVVVTGQSTLDFMAEKLPFLGQFLTLWGWLRYVLLFAIFFLFILAVLMMAAPRGTLRRPLMVSSLIATLALVASSGLFSLFIGLSSRYSLVYGSLVSIIVLLVWLYLCGNILFLAIAFTGVWYRDKQA